MSELNQISTPEEWQTHRDEMRDLFKSLPWEYQRDLKKLADNVDKVMTELDIARNEYRARPTHGNGLAMGKVEDKFNSILKIFNQLLMAARLGHM